MEENEFEIQFNRILKLKSLIGTDKSLFVDKVPIYDFLKRKREKAERDLERAIQENELKQ